MNRILFAVIACLGAVGYVYYMQSQLTLQQQQVKIQEQINEIQAYNVRQKTQEETISVLQEQLEEQTQALNDLIKKSNEIQTEMNRYLDIFKRHSLTSLAAAKPGLIERRVNNATTEVFNAIENDSNSLNNADD